MVTSERKLITDKPPEQWRYIEGSRELKPQDTILVYDNGGGPVETEIVSARHYGKVMCRVKRHNPKLYLK